jgi:hypothetical protein
VICPRRLFHTSLATTARPLAAGWCVESHHRPLAAAHDAAVQTIDTSIVRVHQHGACITRNQRRQSMGRSRGSLTSKIHAVVDSNGLPVRLALSPGEVNDVRLARNCSLVRSPGQCCLPTVAMTPTGSESLP